MTWRGTMGRVVAAGGLLACLGLTGCGKPVASAAPAAGEVLTVYVPCGMERPFTAAQEAFQLSHPGVQVNVVLDNGAVLVRRLLDKGEKADLLVSPGTLEMDTMVQAGALEQGKVTPFGRFELVLFTPRRNPAGVTCMADLAKAAVTTLAIADPAVNSVGKYTRQALEKANLWEVLQPKMTFADHPITAYKHVAREKAEASFAYRSCPLKTAPEKLEYSKIRIIASVPLDSYEPAYACIAPLTTSARAREFIDFLLSPAGQKLLEEYDIPPLAGSAARPSTLPPGGAPEAAATAGE